MSVPRKAEDGVRVLPLRTNLPKVAAAKVGTLDLLPESDPRIAGILKLAKPRPHWPKDFARQHALYVKGHPKKA
jgi:hypothetical protein